MRITSTCTVEGRKAGTKEGERYASMLLLSSVCVSHWEIRDWGGNRGKTSQSRQNPSFIHYSTHQVGVSGYSIAASSNPDQSPNSSSSPNTLPVSSSLSQASSSASSSSSSCVPSSESSSSSCVSSSDSS